MYIRNLQVKTRLIVGYPFIVLPQSTVKNIHGILSFHFNDPN